jgi:hypothetical protein
MQIPQNLLKTVTKAMKSFMQEIWILTYGVNVKTLAKLD